jgi:hypothetical protein
MRRLPNTSTNINIVELQIILCNKGQNSVKYIRYKNEILMEEPKQKIIASTLEKAKYLLPRKKTHKILLGIIALVVTVSITYFALAAPIAIWEPTTSNNCVAQVYGSTFVRVNDTDGEFLYVMSGEPDDFRRYDPKGIAGGTGDCESTALTPPEVITHGASMEAVDFDDDGTDDFIYAYRGGSNGIGAVYDIAHDEWTEKRRTLFDSTTKEVIPEHSSVYVDGEQLIKAYNNDVYVSFGTESGPTYFEIYDTATNTWSTSASDLAALHVGTGATVVGSKIYILFGNGITFKSYDASGDSWSSLANTPSTVYTGSSITGDGTGTYLYALRGNKTKDFWRYDISGNSWETGVLTAPPDFIGEGSMMVRPTGDDKIYVIKGSGSKQFWSYDISADSWSSLTQVPAPMDAAVSRGNSIISDASGSYIYISRGGGTKDFYRYDITGDSWEELESFPIAVGGMGTNLGGITYVEVGPSGEEEIFMVTGQSYGTGLTSPTSLYRYVISSGKWQIFYPPGFFPEANTNGAGYGASWAYPGENTSGEKLIYALKGWGYPNFFKYDMDLTTWIPWNRATFDDGTPIAQQEYREDGEFDQGIGNTMVELDDQLYIFQGNSYIFQKYNPSINNWKELSFTPDSVSYGSALIAEDSDTLYAFRGGGYDSFWEYDVVNDIWYSSDDAVGIGTLDSGERILPTPQSLSITSSAIVEINDIFYEIGNAGIYRYDPSINEWFKLNDYGLNDGGSAIAVGTDIYFVTGGTVNTFYKLDTINNTVTTLAPTPSSPADYNVDQGGSLVYYAGSNSLYLTTGNNQTYFLKYDITGDSWSVMNPTPGAINGGGSITQISSGGNNKIYAIRGDNTQDFYIYDIDTNTWTDLTSSYGVPESVAAGGSLETETSTNSTIYATVGNGTKSLWKYDISNHATGAGTWTQLEDSPQSIGSTATTAARGSLFYYYNSGDPELWLIPGSSENSYALLRYDIAAAEWPNKALPAAPGIIGQGGSLAHPTGSNLIYAFQGGATSNFWFYDITNNTWTSKYIGKYDNGTQLSQSNGDVNQGDGNSIVQVDGNFYVLMGGSNNGLQKFDPDTNTWTALADPPQSTINSAGTLVKYDNNTLYATLQSDQFYKYDIPTDTWISKDLGKLTESSTTAFSQDGHNQGNGNQIAEYDGEFYIIPGYPGGSTTFEKFNPITNTWTPLEGLPYALYSSYGSTLITVDDATYPALYYFRHYNSTSSSYSKLYRYDPILDSWSADLSWNDSPYSLFYAGSDAVFTSYDGADNDTPALYVTRAGNYNNFYKYSITNLETGAGTWSELATTPIQSSYNFYDGSALTVLNNSTSPKIYALHGNSLLNFYEYDIGTNTWTELTPVPQPQSYYTYAYPLTTGGASLTSDGTYIYATLGGNEDFFYRYDPVGDEWKSLAYTPVEMGEYGSYGATDIYGDITYCPNTTNHCDGAASTAAGIWMTPGEYNITYDVKPKGLIYRYDIATDTWPIEKASMLFPGTAGSGAAMAYPGSGDLIYATPGSGSNSFYSYDVVNNAWRSYAITDIDDAGTPLSTDIYQSDQSYGASITRMGDKLYIFPGPSADHANTRDGQFYSYDISDNEWERLPDPERYEYITSGASLTAVPANNAIYAIRGPADMDGNSVYSAYLFDTVTKTWTQFSNPLPYRPYTGADIVYPGTGDYIYYSPGYSSAHDIYRYDINDGTTGSWTTITQTGDTMSNPNGGYDMIGYDDGADGVIYCMRGYNSTDFYKIDLDSSGDGNVSTMSSLPWNVQGGGALATDETGYFGGGSEDYIWATRGSNTANIARYDISADSWTTITDVPANVGYSDYTNALGDIVFVDASNTNSGYDELFVITGNGDNFAGPALLYRYNTNTASWPLVYPLSSPTSNFSHGADFTGLGGTIYAIMGGGTDDFWSYDISTDTWTDLEVTSSDPVPGNVRSGGSLTNDGSGHIYASAGYNTGDVYDYDISGSSWSALPVTGDALDVGIGSTGLDSQGGLAYIGPSDSPSGYWELWATTGDGTYGTSVGDGLIFRYNSNTDSWPMATIPLEQPPTANPVNYGGSLIAVGTDDLYGLRGGNTSSVWNYDIPGDTWTIIAGLPAAVEGGGSLAYDGTYLYATRGFASDDFYRLTGTSWSSYDAADLPVRMGGQDSTTSATNDGGEIAYLNGDIWATTSRGASDWENYFIESTDRDDTGILYRYDIGTNSWPYISEAADLPAGNNKFATGSDLVVSEDGSKIYALRGTSAVAASVGNSNFWEYTVSTDGTTPGSWAQLTNVPNDTTPGYVGDGGALTIMGDYIYAFLGNDTSDFYQYDITGDSWTQQDDLPVTVGSINTSEDVGALEYLPSVGSIFGIPGTDTVSPFTIYKFPILRLSIESVEKTGGGTIYNGDSMTIRVVSLDEENNSYNVPANVDVELSLAEGNGVLGGTLTGTITSGNNYVEIVGATYNTPESGIKLRVDDATTGTPVVRFGGGFSNSFNVETGAITLSGIDVASGPTAGTTGVTATGTNFHTHYYKPIEVQNNYAIDFVDVPTTVLVDTEKLISEGKMRADCGDARFTGSIPTSQYSTETQLDYALVNNCNSSETEFQVIVPSLLASSSVTIYINYGDFTITDGSTDLSTAIDTFNSTYSVEVFSDDFSTGFDTTNTWTEYDGTGDYISWDSGNERLNFTYYYTSTNYGIYTKKNDFKRNKAATVEFDFQPTYNGYYIVAGWKSTLDTLGYYYSTVSSGGYYHGINFNYTSSNDVYEDGSSYNSIGSLSWNTGTTYNIRISMKPSGGAKYERSTNGVDYDTYYESSTLTNTDARFGITKYRASGWLDNVVITEAPDSPTTTVGNEYPTIKLEFGTAEATIANVNPSLTEIKAITTQEDTAGSGPYPYTVDVVATNSYGDSDTLTSAFTYELPSITALVPNSGSTDGGTNVDIQGNYFTPSLYVLPVDLDNQTGGALTDYQIDFDIADTDTLINSGKMRRDMEDVRLYTDSDLATPLDYYYIEGPTYSSSSKIWAKIPTLATGASTIYASYGDLTRTLPGTATFANVFGTSVPDVIGSWNMDESSGTATLADDVDGNDGTMYGTGATTNVTTGQYGNARQFDGSTNYMEVDTAGGDTYNMSDDGITIEAWVNPDTEPWPPKGIIAKIDDQATCSDANLGPGYILYYTYSTLYFKIFYTVSSSYYTYTTLSPSTGTWIHVVARFDPDTNLMKIFLNGSEASSQSATITPSDTHNTKDLIIGAFNPSTECAGYGYNFDGGLDEVRIYNRALTDTEISNLYNNGHGIIIGGNEPEVTFREFTSPDPTATPDTEESQADVTVDSSPISVNSATSTNINFDTPAHSAGAVAVEVTNFDGKSDSETFTYGAVTVTDPDNSTVDADPTTGVEADGVDYSVVTATLLDESMNPVSGKSVQLSVKTGPGSSIIDAVVCADLPTITVLGGDTTTSDSNGEACYRVTTSPASTPGTTGTYEYEAEDISDSVTIVDTATVEYIGLIADGSTSTFSAPAGDVVADGVATKTLTTIINNVNSVYIPGESITVSQESGPGTATISPPDTTDGSGEATHTVSATVAGTYVFRSTDTSPDPDVLLDDDVTVNFIAGPFSNAHSTTGASKSTVLADEIDSSTVTVTINDAFDNPISGKTVSLAETSGPGGSNIITVQGVTDASGEAIFTVTADTAGTYVFTATNVTDGNTDLTDTESIDFTGPTAGDSTVETDADRILSDGTHTAKITATTLDSSSNVFPSRSITLSQGAGSAVIDAINCDTEASLGSGVNSITDSNGEACYFVSDSTKEVVTFTAYNNNEGFYITDTAEVTFDDGIGWPAEELVAGAVSGPYYSVYETQVARIINSSLEHEYVVAWEDHRDGGNYIYAQKFSYDDTTHTLAEEWTSGGVLVRNAGGASLSDLKIHEADDQDVILTWVEGSNIYVQVIGQSGVLGWTYIQSDVACSSGDITCYQAIPDRDDSPSFGIFLSYSDDTDGKTYLTHIDEFGSVATGEITTWPVDLGAGYPYGDSCVTIPSMFLYDDLVPAVFYGIPTFAPCGTMYQTWTMRYRTYNQSSPISMEIRSDAITDGLYNRDGTSNTDDCFIDVKSFGNYRIISDNDYGAYLLWYENCQPGETFDDYYTYLAHMTNPIDNSWILFLGNVGDDLDYDMIAPGSIDGVILASDLDNIVMDRIDDNSGAPDLVWGGASGDYVEVAGTSGYGSNPHLLDSGDNFYVFWNSNPGGGVKNIRGSLFDFGATLETGWSTYGNSITTTSSLPEMTDASNEDYGFETSNDISSTVVGTALDGGALTAYNGKIYHNYTEEDMDNFVQGFTETATSLNSAGDVIVADPDPPNEKTQENQKIVTTGTDEFVVAWEDRAYDGGYPKVYAEKFDADGVRQWNPDEPGIGIPLYPVYSSGHYHENPVIAPDISGGSKTGGIIEAHYRFGGGTGYIELQKMNDTGSLQWTTDGYQLDSGTTVFSSDISITSDNNGGAYIMYKKQNGSSMWTIWGQNVLSAGTYNATWGAGAQEMVSSSGTRYDYENPEVLYHPGSSYLYLITERTDHNNSDKREIMVYKYSKTTGALSTSAAISTIPGEQWRPGENSAYLDPTGSYIYIIFQDYSSGGITYLQKLATSNLNSLYGSSGKIISSTEYDGYPAMALDATGAPLITWQRWYDETETHSDIVVTRIDPDTGTLLWGETVITDATELVPKEEAVIASDGGTGAFVVWTIPGETDRNVYTQHIVGSIQQDTQYGVEITTPTADTFNVMPVIAGDDARGVFMAWAKFTTPADIYAQYYVQLDGFDISNNSSFVTDKTDVLYDGSDYAILTATVLDDLDAPVVGDTIDVDIISGSTSGITIDAVVCADLPSITVLGGDTSTTDSNGEACFRVTGTTEDTRTFAAIDTTQSATLPDTPSIYFGLVYCTPPDVDGSSTNYGIINFTLDSAPAIDNDSTAAYTGSSPYSPLQDFTDTVTPGGIYKNATFQGSVDHPGSITSRGYIWIDYNRDGDFYDTGEEVASYINPVTPSSTDNFSTFVVPETATEGITGMRVLSGYELLDTIDPCYVDFSVGAENAEFEDYLVDIGTLVPSTTHSNFGAYPLTIPADDTTTTTLYVTVRNDADVPIPGEEITLALWGGGAIPGDITIVPDPTTPQTTDEDGEVTYTIRSGTPQVQAFEATIVGIGTITEGPTIEFTYPDFAVSTFTADPTIVAADGTETSKLYATILSVGAMPFQNTTVTITDSPISDTPTLHYDEIDCTTEAIITADSNIGTTNSSGEACFFVTSTTVGTSEFTATSKGTELDDQPQVQFHGEPSVINSTLVADPQYVPADGATASTLTATIKDGSTIGYPIEDEVVSLTQTSGLGTPVITAIDCPSPEPAGSSPGTTNVNGKACFEVTSDTQEVVEFTAEATSNHITVSTDVTFGCIAGPNEQCIQVNIGEAGVLALDIPSGFYLPAITYDPNNSQETFSIDEEEYPFGYDILTVTDTRNSGGFELQVQASAFEEETTLEQIPLQNLYIATKAASTGGLQLNGIEYGSGVTPAEEVSAELDTSGAFDNASTFTSLLPGGMGTGGTGTVIVVQDGSLSVEPGRLDTFSQIVHYYLNAPAGQSPGEYIVTISFDLIAL